MQLHNRERYTSVIPYARLCGSMLIKLISIGGDCSDIDAYPTEICAMHAPLKNSSFAVYGGTS